MGRPALGATAASLALGVFIAGCGGTNTPRVAPGALAPADSWMDGRAASSDLLYVAVEGTLYVYTYPRGKLAGTLRGGDFEASDCSDKAGNVWAADFTGSRMIEYAHGGTKPKAVLDDPSESPYSCSIDPTTGNLAVINLETQGSLPGNVAIYAHAKGKPRIYRDRRFNTMYFGSYDDKGNLFVDGWARGETVHYYKLAKGTAQFKEISIGESAQWPSDIKWDGKHIAVLKPNSYGNEIDQIAGSKVIGKTPLLRACNVVSFVVDGSVAITSDSGCSILRFYRYPGGGKPFKGVLVPQSLRPLGITLSHAP